jgi:hypothetical protein
VTAAVILVCGLNDARQPVCQFVDFAGGPVCDAVLLDGLRPHGSACFAARDRRANLFYFGSTDSPVVLAGRLDGAGKIVVCQKYEIGVRVVGIAVLLEKVFVLG